MATLEQKIIEAAERQTRQYIEERNKMARVTLLAPYEYNNGIVTLRYGSEEATVIGRGQDDEVIDLTRVRTRIIPGRPIHFHFSMTKQNMKCVCQDEPFEINETIVMPLPVAQIYFGNWTKFDQPLRQGENPDTEDTMQWQKKRAAEVWGGYRKRPRSQAQYIGNDWRSLESIGPPKMPNVEIVRLDSQFRKLPNSTFRPLEVYAFEKDLVPDRWTQDPANTIITVTEKDFKEAIAAEVARLMSEQSKKKVAV